MNKLQRNGNDSEIASAIHLEFIQNSAQFNDGNGLEDVETYHRAIFLNHYAQDLERFRQQTKIHEDRLKFLETRLQETEAKLVGLDKLVAVSVNGEDDVRPTAPWNNWDLAMFGVSLAGILCMMIFGVLNISFNLLESGIVTFQEHPIRAYFWAALLPVGALGVKVGWDFLRSTRTRDIYLWCTLAAGVAGVMVWVFAYASVYPTLSKTTEEHIASLRVFNEQGSDPNSLNTLTFGGAKQMDMIIVAAQSIAEICLSAALGIYMTMIYIKHRPVRLAQNPAFAQLDEEHRLLEDGVSRERSAMAEAKGNEDRLDNQLSVFVAFAKTLFQKEVALHRDKSHQKRLLFGQIEEQLRSQLESLENGEPTTTESSFRAPSIADQKAS